MLSERVLGFDDPSTIQQYVSTPPPPHSGGRRTLTPCPCLLCSYPLCHCLLCSYPLCPCLLCPCPLCSCLLCLYLLCSCLMCPCALCSCVHVPRLMRPCALCSCVHVPCVHVPCVHVSMCPVFMRPCALCSCVHVSWVVSGSSGGLPRGRRGEGPGPEVPPEGASLSADRPRRGPSLRRHAGRRSTPATHILLGFMATLWPRLHLIDI